jgi:hypothetical protein
MSNEKQNIASAQRQLLNIAGVSRRNSLRYRLHRKIRKEGFKLITRDRTIYFPYGEVVPESKSLKILINEFGYAVQFYYDG